MAISGAGVLVSGVFTSPSVSANVKDVYYICCRDAVNAKLNSKYLHVTIKGNKEDVITALARVRNDDGMCPNCGSTIQTKTLLLLNS